MTPIRPSTSLKSLPNQTTKTKQSDSKLNPLAPQKESLDRILYRVDLGGVMDEAFKGGNAIEHFKKLGSTYGFKATEHKSRGWIEDEYIVKNDQSVIETERLGIQGGNILSVGDKNGKVKHLVGEDELLKLSVEGNSILALEEGSFSHLSQEDKQKAIAKMAKILNVDSSEIIPIPQSKGRYFHIDGEISGLEDGKVAMNHPKVMLEALEKVDRKKLSTANQIILDEHIKATKESLQKYGKEYDKTVEILKKEGLDVALVPGYSSVRIGRSNFKTNPVSKALYEEYSKIPIPDKEDAEEYARIYPSIEEGRYYWHMEHTAETQISFNNGILGKTKAGKGYMITNGSKAFKDLEKYFSTSIKSQSKKLQDVIFVENNVMTFGNGGIQCLTNEYAEPSSL
jgi:hypothetical protein